MVVFFAKETRFSVLAALHNMQRHAIQVYARTSRHVQPVTKIFEPGPVCGHFRPIIRGIGNAAGFQYLANRRKRAFILPIRRMEITGARWGLERSGAILKTAFAEGQWRSGERLLGVSFSKGTRAQLPGCSAN